MDSIVSSHTILIADDDPAVRFVLEQAIGRGGFRVIGCSDGAAVLQHLAAGVGELVITDIVMPGGSGLDLLKTVKGRYPLLPVIVITAQSTLLNAVRAFEWGAFEYLPKPFDINQVVELVRRALQQEWNPERNGGAAGAGSDPHRFGGIIGSSAAMQELFRTIGRLSNSEMTALIHGESGTGKELVARAIHGYSPRRNGPFVAINMAAIPKELIESELFGHEKGAFTGALARRDGYFKRAEGGTLFFDEIGDMPMDAQTRLLRVLQEGNYSRVGGGELLTSNVRIIAATHQNLPAAIAQGRFREDLYYRLNVIPLQVPSLRSRREDIPLLVECFLANTASELHTSTKQFSSAALRALMEYSWPGNVRELENLVRRMMVLVPERQIEVNHLQLPGVVAPLAGGVVAREPPVAVAPVGGGAGGAGDSPASLAEVLTRDLDRFFSTLNGVEATGLYDMVIQQVEGILIGRVLKETRGNQVRASAILGINRNTLRKKIAELDIDYRR